MDHGIPLFLGQLIDTLRAKEVPQEKRAPKSAGRDLPSEITAGASRHGRELLEKGFTVDQVVHDYGDLCQAVTELAVEAEAKVTAEEFRTFNQCLDDAIADAVTEFGWQRDRVVSERSVQATNERLGFLAHELRNFLNTAMLSFAAMKNGSVAINGATARVLERSLTSSRDLIDNAMAEVRLAAGLQAHIEFIAVDRFIEEILASASLQAEQRKCDFAVGEIEPGLAVHADAHLLYSAVSNLLQNAFKFTRPNSLVSLRAHSAGANVLIEVEDQCGGLPAGKIESMFHPFEQHSEDRSGAGLGLSIARRAIEACGGRLRVRDLPGAGCVFTIELPRREDVTGLSRPSR
jgi:signal transduction histidine kinase